MTSAPPPVATGPAPATGLESLLVRLVSIVEVIDLGAVFPMAQPLEVELGSGDGGFLLEYAQRHPERNFIGVERLLGRIRKLDRKGRRRGLANLRGVRLEAGYLIRYLLPAGSVSAVHVYFPDPWPKRRHHRRRLVNEPFASSVQRVLTPGGAVFLRTDFPEYFEQMNRVFGGHHAFEPMATPDDLAAVLTDFERDYLAQGRPTLRAAYRRRPELLATTRSSRGVPAEGVRTL